MTALEELRSGGNRSGAYGRLERWGELITGRGACALPDGAARFVLSALRGFREAFDDHARYGACEACATSRALPIVQRERVPA